MTFNFKLLVRLPNGTTTWIQMSAENMQVAQQIAEAQYGAGNVINIITL